MVFGFDKSYFMFYNKDAVPSFCPNELYVAATRASEKMTVFHHYEHNFLPFLNVDNIPVTAEVIMARKLDHSRIRESESINTDVTDLTRHQPEDTIEEAYNLLETRRVHKPGSRIDIPIKTKQGGFYENVSEINGVAIPAYFELHNRNKISILKEVKYINYLRVMREASSLPDAIREAFEVVPKKMIGIHDDNEMLRYIGEAGFRVECYNPENNEWIDARVKGIDYPEVAGVIRLIMVDEEDNYDTDEAGDELGTEYILYPDLTPDDIKPGTLLELANLWCAIKSGYNHKTNQITGYGWLSQDDLDRCLGRLSGKITKDSTFERRVDISGEPELLNRNLIGYIDCIDGNNVWEFKCVEKLNREHFLQLAVYMYIYELRGLGIKKDYGRSLLVEALEFGDIVHFRHPTGMVAGVVISKPDDGYINLKNMVTKRSNKVAIGDLILDDDLISESETETDDDVLEIRCRYYLLNILTNETYEIKATIKDLRRILEILINQKYVARKTITDEEFVNRMNEIKQRYFEFE